MASSPSIPASSGSEKKQVQALQQKNTRLRQQKTAAEEQQVEQQRYERSQERFRTVFENSPMGQKIIDPDLRIRQANQALATMLGLKNPKKVEGRRIIEFAHPDFVQDWATLQEQLWAHKKPWFALETCLVRVDKSSFWCRVTSVLFPDEEGELGYTSLEDITERKEMELANQKLYDTQETMLHLAAHDLKNPIVHIRMVMHLLRTHAGVRGIEPETDRLDVEKLLGVVEQACGTADALLRDVLFLGQLEADRSRKHRTDLGALLDKRLQAFRLAAQEKEIHLHLELPKTPIHANIHADKFGRILDNLLSNALNFTFAGGTIRVALRQLKNSIRLVVKDTGLGIPEALQPHVFDKFSKAARPGLYGDTTTGLGLFITKQIVEKHQGKIWLESREKEGTTFFIELP
ncbi:PAS domain-containing sensor histidine kinase [Hymenobacter cellulosilyticus]|uniref:histidine kinase n=1 Tax=Hymenobacter cellulosilyticus TaxID=2932248 RepID=A0A8T9Q997_9BACT|nr:PAS domain-containing sensor histidine kinase [Hymenobacter cellulosilyticus]UOQ74107.1 PAS domain-containing sensor histidine kinase [Hymenobacter cellulosilyticus]